MRPMSSSPAHVAAFHQSDPFIVDSGPSPITH
jgi:hypothetical protein